MTSLLSLARGTAGAAVALTLGACAYLPSIDGVLGAVTPYRVEIVQGNVVTREQLARVKPGSTRLQVRDALGTPLLTDPFHADRWDYLFTIRRRGTDPQRVSIVLQFDGDALKTIDAPELPSENDFVASISREKAAESTRILALSDDQRRALPPALPPSPPTAEAFRPDREYPPMESAQIVRELPSSAPPAPAEPASAPSKAP